MPTETAATESVSDRPRPTWSSARRRRDVRARDRRAARPAVGLEDVAVEPERPLPERLHVGDGAEGAADQALDLDRPPLLLAGARLALRALPGRGREHRVLGRQPAAPVADEPARDAVLERRRAEHPRLAERDQRRAARLLEVVRARSSALEARRGGGRSDGSCRGRLELGDRDLLDLAERELQEALADARGSAPDRRSSGTGRRPSRPCSFSNPLRSSVSATSRAVSSAEKTSVTPRPKTRWKIGRISG